VVQLGGHIVVLETGMSLRLLPFDLGVGVPGFQDRLRLAQKRLWSDNR
jgi:hypothetical protein